MNAHDITRAALAQKKALQPDRDETKRRALEAIHDGVEPADVCLRFRISRTTLNAWRRESK